MKRLLHLAATLAAALLFGGLVTLGVLVTTLRHADPAVHRRAVPILFENFEYLGLAAGTLALLLCGGLWLTTRRALPLVAATLALLATSALGVERFAITPAINRMTADGLAGTPEFGRTHGIGMMLYLAAMLCALGVVLLLPFVKTTAGAVAGKTRRDEADRLERTLRSRGARALLKSGGRR